MPETGEERGQNAAFVPWDVTLRSYLEVFSGIHLVCLALKGHVCLKEKAIRREKGQEE